MGFPGSGGVAVNVPYVVPEDEVTPYPADFERVMDAVREMGYALDVI